MKPFSITCGLFVFAASATSAVEVQKFTKDTYEEFAKGEARGVSITEKGELRLAPAVTKVCDVATPIVWAAARDSKGNVYLGGSDGKVWRAGNDGKPAVFFTAKELEIHALAVDAKDNVYAASSPDGKVYRIDPDGKSSVFYDPPDKYIWSLLFDHGGNLFVACGSKANIYEVAPDGIARKYFASDETNIVSLGLDAKGKLLAGSEPGAYLYRIEQPNRGFVVYDSPLKELKAIATDTKGNIFAIALGEAEKPATTTTTTGTKTEEKKTSRSCELYRVLLDGYTETLWTGKDATAMSLAVGNDGTALVGTGDRGVIYAVKSRDEISTLVKLDGQQVTALLAGAGDSLTAATSNLGAIWSISQARAIEGTWESEALDAKSFSSWGVVHLDTLAPGGGKLAVSSRSGNTEKAEKTWTDWADAEVHGADFALKSPAARYLQVRVRLATADGKHPPAVDRLDVYYTPRNLPPQITKLTIYDGGYGLQKIVQPEAAQQTTVDGITTSTARRDPMESARKQRIQIQPQPGLRIAKWAANDPNLDVLTFDVYLRAENESAWKLLAERTGDFFFTWDSRSFPDGYYRVKIVASDAQSNPPGKGLSASLESASFPVDNTPPKITVQSAKLDPDGSLTVKFTVADAMTPIASVEVSADGKDWLPVFPEPNQMGGRQQELTARLAGAKSVFIRARDEAGNAGAAKAVAKAVGK